MLPATKEDMLKLLKNNRVSGYKETRVFFANMAKDKRLDGKDITYEWMIDINPVIFEILWDELQKLKKNRATAAGGTPQPK